MMTAYLLGARTQAAASLSLPTIKTPSASADFLARVGLPVPEDLKVTLPKIDASIKLGDSPQSAAGKDAADVPAVKPKIASMLVAGALAVGVFLILRG